jgi:hypothetical protein
MKTAKIRVAHTFYGETEGEAEAVLLAHAEACPKFGPAYHHNHTVEVSEEIDALPTPETVEDFVGGEPDEDDEDGDDE